MTLDEAEDLAARTLAAIDKKQPAAEFLREHGFGDHGRDTLDADRERVASDLAGLRDHAPDTPYCAWTNNDSMHKDMDEPCDDATRYADNLRRTAALYGIS